MGALEYLREWAAQNRTAGSVLSGAVACFAALVVITQFGVDLESQIPAVLYVIAIGLGFYIVVGLLDGPLARRAAGLCLAALALIWSVAFFWSRSHPRNEELACAVYFWTPCVITADAIAETAAAQAGPSSPARPPVSAPAPTTGTATVANGLKSNYRVYIQFAGYARPTIVNLARDLATQGWNIQGQDSGGERTGNAARLAEVRYRDASARSAAEALASALNASKITPTTVKAVPLSIIRANTLEVWLGQP